MAEPEITRDALDAALSAGEREQREESNTARRLKQAQAQIAELEKKVDILTSIDGIDCTPPDWTQPPKQRKDARGIACLMLSDLHLDEVVLPEQMNGRNAYNREIALRRLHETGARTIRLARDFVTGIRYDGLVVWLGGDNVSGNIHAELRRTNAGQDVIDTVDYWVDPLCALLLMLADHFRRVRVIAVPGNHARNTDKPESKDAVRSSFDWLLARILWRETKSDGRISWNIPEAIMVQESVYRTRFHFEHGDAKAFKGGDQIAGPLRPALMGRNRRRQQGYDFDHLLLCHFHSYASLTGLTINGSLIGPSQFGEGSGFSSDPPRQAFWVETPENGSAFSMPVLPCDPKAEGWGS